MAVTMLSVQAVDHWLVASTLDGEFSLQRQVGQAEISPGC